MHHKALWPLTKKANRGFRGYPVATVAFDGPDDRRASKVAVGILPREGAQASELERWFSEEGDVRDDVDIAEAMLSSVEQHGANTIAVVDRIIGCPHEEGVDYPDGQKCPQWRQSRSRQGEDGRQSGTGSVARACAAFAGRLMGARQSLGGSR